MPVSRRAFLGGTAAAAAAVALPVVAGSPARAVAGADPLDIIFGTSAQAFQAMRAAVPGTFACRQYIHAGTPAAWPTGGAQAAGADPLVLSWHPDVDALLAGALDAAISQFCAGAPAGSWLAPWHEANLQGNVFRTSGHTPDQFRAMCARVHRLARKANPGLHVGQILGTFRLPDAGWVTPGLDFYGLDGYGRPFDAKTPADKFGPYIDTILAAEPGARLAITETNAAQRPTTADEIRWLWQSFHLARRYHMAAWLTWWGPHNGYPSFDPAGGYVPALRKIAARAAGAA